MGKADHKYPGKGAIPAKVQSLHFEARLDEANQLFGKLIVSGRANLRRAKNIGDLLLDAQSSLPDDVEWDPVMAKHVQC